MTQLAAEYNQLTEEEGTYGESVAKSLGVDPGRMYKTLIAEVDGSPVVAVVPTDKQLGGYSYSVRNDANARAELWRFLLDKLTIGQCANTTP